MSEATTTRDYRKRIAKHMFDNTPLPVVAYMAFGDAGSNGSVPKTPDDTRTQLYHEVLRKPLSTIIQEDDLSVTGKGVLTKTELIGVSISEAALLDSSGNMLGFKNFAPKIKDADEEYDIKIKLKF